MTATRTSPVVFLVLILPFGVMSGYLSVAVAWELSHAGLSVEEVAALVAASFVPHTWKFLWAPAADTTLRRKSWYLWAGG
ncbi:MAG TPA: MFS transporter, partial [Casimicrobiaceae bacterium]|nr:MFS transporter [Casimicrobiaceae bacterium]